MSQTRPLSGLVFRNSVTNVATQGLLMLLAFVCLPVLAHGFGKSDFGLLTLLWAVIGHFSLLDFGISRAITKFAAEAIGRKDPAGLRKTVWVSVTASLGFGILTCVLLMAAAPLLVRDVFSLGAAEQGPAMRAFMIAALGIPLTLLTGTIRGVQMAFQRFGAVNITQAINGIIQWAGAALLASLGQGLESVMVVTVVARVLSFVVALILLLPMVPGLFTGIRLWDGLTARRLFTFGGWVTVSQAVNPLFQYLDRFMVGAFVSIAAVGYYSVPQEALFRLLVIPLSLTLTLFPALSYQSAQKSPDTWRFYLQSLKLSFVALLPVGVILIVFGRDILTVWLGREFADACSLVFQILSIGLLFSMVGQIPATVLHAHGRPDLSAKLNLAELPLMVVMNLLLIPRFGIVGAAVTWTVRVLVDALLVFWFAHRVLREEGPHAEFHWVWRSLAVQGAVGLLAMALPALMAGFAGRATVFGIFLALFLGSAWAFFLNQQDRALILRLGKSVFAQ